MPKLTPGIAEEAEPVSMANVLNIVFRITSPSEEFRNLLQVGNGIEVIGTLLLSEPPIQVGPNPDMKSIPCKLTDMIHVVDHDLQ